MGVQPFPAKLGSPGLLSFRFPSTVKELYNKLINRILRAIYKFKISCSLFLIKLLLFFYSPPFFRLFFASFLVNVLGPAASKLAAAMLRGSQVCSALVFSR
ncbi:hypothetical protein SGRA_3425 [Saprospira grandis str. Lewin]|uniref:Uncharacterized protein n=1 Tax=Saprospira grandis (strain Lewin) TaxID=984262 RepID=H6L1S2_SAPGL|nr:hypothetical protein SGRA_3425 [Saprospira grandis str. Lewin]